MSIFDHGRTGAAPVPRTGATVLCREDRVHDVVVLVLSDDTLLDALEELRVRLGGLLEPGPSRLVVDLSRVSRLSSATIATLLWVKRTCAARAVDVVVRRPSRGSVGVLHRTGLLTAPTTDPGTLTRGVGVGASGAPHGRGRS
ncbi:STAS domain-containing protein [Nocardioides terrigena]|uniref:STAS domain-containing protein n=1 Tax=Nocardioides terrigena TaxID=424797 RepID=UPI001901C643|nr:STAS domain-containing protein [Nocardioides terrigena]